MMGYLMPDNEEEGPALLFFCVAPLSALET